MTDTRPFFKQTGFEAQAEIAGRLRAVRFDAQSQTLRIECTLAEATQFVADLAVPHAGTYTVQQLADMLRGGSAANREAFVRYVTTPVPAPEGAGAPPPGVADLLPGHVRPPVPGAAPGVRRSAQAPRPVDAPEGGVQPPSKEPEAGCPEAQSERTKDATARIQDVPGDGAGCSRDRTGAQQAHPSESSSSAQPPETTEAPPPFVPIDTRPVLTLDVPARGGPAPGSPPCPDCYATMGAHLGTCPRAPSRASRPEPAPPAPAAAPSAADTRAGLQAAAQAAREAHPPVPPQAAGQKLMFEPEPGMHVRAAVHKGETVPTATAAPAGHAPAVLDYSVPAVAPEAPTAAPARPAGMDPARVLSAYDAPAQPPPAAAAAQQTADVLADLGLAPPPVQAQPQPAAVVDAGADGVPPDVANASTFAPVFAWLFARGATTKEALAEQAYALRDQITIVRDAKNLEGRADRWLEMKGP